MSQSKQHSGRNVSDTKSLQVVVVGGGLAGLAAAAELEAAGMKVCLVEGRRRCGGRAASFESGSGGLVDACQHVAMGCCTNFLDLCRQAGLADYLRRDKTLWFIGPDGRRAACTPAGWLPAPFHLTPLLFGMQHFSLREKTSLAVGMLRLAIQSFTSTEANVIEPTADEWLTCHQPERVVQLFWQPVIESALGESIDHVGITAVQKVVVDGFLSHPQSADLLVPTLPLGELFGDHLVTWLKSRGVVISTGQIVSSVQRETSGFVTGVHLGEDFVRADLVVLAVPWRAASRLIPDLLPEVDDSFVGSPITAVHLWFDRPIVDLPHAVLVGRVSQWVFPGERSTTDGEHHCQVVISASRGLLDGDRDRLLATVVEELRDVFPVATEAQLLRSRIVTDPTAVLSVRPGIEAVRPRAETAAPNLFLAGDWVATGWPSTMEGAVRSGRQAAMAACRWAGYETGGVVADLPKNWLVRLLTAASARR